MIQSLTASLLHLKVPMMHSGMGTTAVQDTCMFKRFADRKAGCAENTHSASSLIPHRLYFRQKA